MKIKSSVNKFINNKINVIGLLLILAVVVGGLFILFDGNNASSGSIQPVSDELISRADIVVKITKDGFSPEEVTIKLGQTVIWINEDSEFRWPASNIHPTHEIYSEFDPKEPMGSEEVYLFTFEKIGEWRYHDHLKPNKLGIVKVTE